MPSLKKEFRLRLAAVEERLLSIPEEKWTEPYASGSWLRKQVLGHLVDSATNNHLRFVMAALDGRFEGPGYDSNGWVALHNYGNRPWKVILQYWRSRNSQLSEVVDNLPEDRLAAPCRIGDEPAAPLRTIILSYLEHMEHHTNQIVDGVSSI